LELTKGNNYFFEKRKEQKILDVRNDQRAIKNNFYQHPEIQSCETNKKRYKMMKFHLCSRSNIGKVF
jgi:LAO/AO transport system kinase